ncbi:MAG: trypsin-like peptidase domain-containing protein [Alphaproteobacteria bacterium]|nr:trypsin-like peptidase domain-containing protein [Alphaproteobacteria bacterium]
MVDERDAESQSEAAALEHLTGPSRGKVTWLSGSALDITLSPNRYIRVSEAHPGEPQDNLVARLHRAEDSYEIEAIESRPLWVNGVRATARKLTHGDMIEFDETGPVSRFCLFRENRSVRTTVAEIMSDALDYIRVSRKPPTARIFTGLCQVLRRLTRNTTILFRVGIVLAVVALAIVTYQQSRLDTLLEERIDSGAARLEGFAAALSRARQEALTPNDLQALRAELGRQLSTSSERLETLEQRSLASSRVIANAMPSIAFLQGAYGFREQSSGRMLRHTVDDDGRPLISPRGQSLLTLDGDGPVAERQFTGTGFVVGDGGALVTNRHVALPWEDDANVETLAGQDLEPVMIKFIAYLPGQPGAEPVELLRASEEADLAVLVRGGGVRTGPGLTLADGARRPGDEVIVMGYPTGLRSMLAQSGDKFIERLQEDNDTGFWSVAARLAEEGYIAPLASRGIVGQISPATIVYDAETTLGGSGGPVLDIDGAVIAVNTAILPEFGGSNLGVPVAMVRALLAEAGLR